MVKKQFPIGIQNLAELRQGNYYYVDKTAKIIELINTRDLCTNQRPTLDTNLKLN